MPWIGNVIDLISYVLLNFIIHFIEFLDIIYLIMVLVCLLVRSYAFFKCRKGDYNRYLAEFKSGREREEAADQSMKAYEVSSILFVFPEASVFPMSIVRLVIEVISDAVCLKHCKLWSASNTPHQTWLGA